MSTTHLLPLLGIRRPIVQAPMAGVSTPAMAAAVSNAGGLGSLGLGAMSAEAAEAAMSDFRQRSAGPLNVNVFCHAPAKAEPEREKAWLEHLRPEFLRANAQPPEELKEIYRTFDDDEEMLKVVLRARPRVVSFHFGVPKAAWLRALREAGIVLLASATSLEEARALMGSGIDAVVAQGYEAGGHRGVFDPQATDDRLGTLVLTRLLSKSLSIPVIAAGGIMDGEGIAAALRLGASAAQLGTAFIATDESAADRGYRDALFSRAAHHTVMTRAISGRPARCLANRFTALGEAVGDGAAPAYPIAYDAGKALHAAMKTMGESGYGAQWAGQGAPLARALPAARLMQDIISELDAAL
jgi:nitronate monooxygenase